MQLDDLKHEVEIQTEIAEKRLVEIQTYSQRNQELVRNVQDLNNQVCADFCLLCLQTKYMQSFQIKSLPSDIIKKSSEYMCLETRYNALFDEAKRLEVGNQDLRAHVIDLRKCYEEQLKTVRVCAP